MINAWPYDWLHGTAECQHDITTTIMPIFGMITNLSCSSRLMFMVGITLKPSKLLIHVFDLLTMWICVSRLWRLTDQCVTLDNMDVTQEDEKGWQHLNERDWEVDAEKKTWHVNGISVVILANCLSRVRTNMAHIHFGINAYLRTETQCVPLFLSSYGYFDT